MSSLLIWSEMNWLEKSSRPQDTFCFVEVSTTFIMFSCTAPHRQLPANHCAWKLWRFLVWKCFLLSVDSRLFAIATRLSVKFLSDNLFQFVTETKCFQMRTDVCKLEFILIHCRPSEWRLFFSAKVAGFGCCCGWCHSSGTHSWINGQRGNQTARERERESRNKLKDIILSLGRGQTELISLFVNKRAAERVDGIRFLQLQISDDLVWLKRLFSC